MAKKLTDRDRRMIARGLTRNCAKIVAHVKRLDLCKFPLPSRIVIERTRAGYWQKSAGAFLWFLYAPDDIHHKVNKVGSTCTAVEIARCLEVEAEDVNGDIHLWPCSAYRKADERKCVACERKACEVIRGK